MKNHIIYSFIFLLSLFVFKIEAQVISEKDEFVENLLAKMTLEEKIGQMNQYSGFFDATGPAPESGRAKERYKHIKAGMVGSMLNVRGVENVRALQKIAVENSRLGIPLIFGFDVIHGYKTIMPVPLAEAASWDLDIIRKSAEVAAAEAAAAGLNWTFAPMVDVGRDARWGRVMEGAGEDPYFGSLVAAARVKGFQGEDLSSEKTIAACAKHFAGYAFAIGGRDYNTVDIGTSTLYNTVFPPFKAAVEAGVSTFMNSFNVINGIPATADEFLQREILKGKWNFEGFVVSDWGTIFELINHGYAENIEQATAMAANAGCDMDMESAAYVSQLKELVESGKVAESKVDDAARRILKVKKDLGLFEDPYKYCDEDRQKTVIGSAENHQAAFEIAQRSFVLLKNENNLLPLPKSGKKIALIGDLADDKTSPLGNWRLAADENTAISVLEGLNAYDGNEVTFESGPTLIEKSPPFYAPLTVNTTDKSGFDEAVAAAKEADIVLMVLGEHGMQSGEGRSRSKIDLPGFQQELLEAVFAVNKNVVLLLMNGRPLAIDWAADNIPAILEVWQPGTACGKAVASVLYGEYNPSGKLPMTFPRRTGQVPVYYNHKNTGRPAPKSANEVFFSHYNDILPNKPLFPFGFGLSYTNFEYAGLEVSVKEDMPLVSVAVNVTNTGEVFGEEVVQLYIRDKVASVTRPVQELKGFEKIGLNPGQSKKVNFTLTGKELGFYNNQGDFVVESGDFEVMVGGNSGDVKRTNFKLSLPQPKSSKTKK